MTEYYWIEETSTTAGTEARPLQSISTAHRRPARRHGRFGRFRQRIDGRHGGAAASVDFDSASTAGAEAGWVQPVTSRW
jgi:hypothetical protein